MSSLGQEPTFNPFALRKAKTVYNLGLSKCKRAKSSLQLRREAKITSNGMLCLTCLCIVIKQNLPVLIWL